MDFWNAEQSVSKPLSEEDFFAAIDAIKNAPPSPCSQGQHLVSPKARYRPGWYVCGWCLMPVEVKVPLAEL